ncbi:MAG: AAA family ATPase [Chromatiales bacterium]|jgi:HTH-type transcriptional regulator, transcriptional repressor of NAD biosynthesis genes|nr:AAA family ATPase [Chromatiales bacterium]
MTSNKQGSIHPVSNGAKRLTQPAARGLIVGSFMPAHAGHRLLMEFGRVWCDELVVALLHSPEDAINLAVRQRWLQELAPDLTVVEVALESGPPSTIEPDSVAAKVGQVMPGSFEVLIGSKARDEAIASALNMRFIGVDPEQLMVPVGATDVREDPMSHWELIPECARSHFARRVCVYGPGGTGKSALVEQLTIHYDTAWATEYRPPGKAPMELGDMPRIGRAQAAIEDAMARQSNRVLICDGGVLGTAVKSKVAFKQCPQELRELSDARAYHQILLMDLDPVLADTAPKRRFEAAQREFDAYRNELIEADRRYLRLDGDYDTRFRIACDAIDILIGQPTRRPPRPDL